MAYQNQYGNTVDELTEAHTRLIRNYDGPNKDFDYIIIGSGMGGGVLADNLAEKTNGEKRILIIDSGSFIYPTHVYNFIKVDPFKGPNDPTKFTNLALSQHFKADHFDGRVDAGHQIGEGQQMVFGGRSIFWSGLIPQMRNWELDYFPESVRNDLKLQYHEAAGQQMNASVSLGSMADRVVDSLKAVPFLNENFEIVQTTRALHQSYLDADGDPTDQYFKESTGVFNTAELLLNQMGKTPGADPNGNGLFLRLCSFVESVSDAGHGWHEVKTTPTTLKGGATESDQVSFYSKNVIIATGVIESPKLMARSDAYKKLSPGAKDKVGKGLTDHPVSSSSEASVTGLNHPSGPIALTKEDHAKVILYSKGKEDNGRISYPFNIEVNVNHLYWHYRESDNFPAPGVDDSAPMVDLKFSFANCLDDYNQIFSHLHDGYKPDVRFRRFANLDYLLSNRFPAMAGNPERSQDEFFSMLHQARDQVFSAFTDVNRISKDYGHGDNKQWPFGYGTVHHACGTLRMPWKDNKAQAAFNQDSVVDENLEVRGTPGLYVCDMSVMPFSSAANPVKALTGLAMRLSDKLAQ